MAATPGAVGTFRWSAPEIMNPPRKENSTPVMESKTADVFAFGMLAVEVFTGKIPFEEHKSEAVVLRISQGGRPEMPENAQAVGLTGEIWKLESCWQQNPRRRPTMDKIVKRWEKFVENVSLECVQSSSVPVSTSYDQPREPQPLVGSTQGTSRYRVKTEAPPPTRPGTTRLRTTSEFARPLTRPETGRLRTMSEVVQPPIRPEAARPRTQSPALRPSESILPGGYRSRVLM